MQKDYFETNLKRLLKKSRPVAYRPEFKETLFSRMAQELCQGRTRASRPAVARPGSRTEAVPRILNALARSMFQPARMRLILEAAALPAILVFVGISYLTDPSVNLQVADKTVIIYRAASNQDYSMVNGQNVVNRITHASSSLGNCPTRTGVQSGSLPQNLLQLAATNNG